MKKVRYRLKRKTFGVGGEILKGAGRGLKTLGKGVLGLGLGYGLMNAVAPGVGTALTGAAGGLPGGLATGGLLGGLATAKIGQAAINTTGNILGKTGEQMS